MALARSSSGNLLIAALNCALYCSSLSAESLMVESDPKGSTVKWLGAGGWRESRRSTTSIPVILSTLGPNERQHGL